MPAKYLWEAGALILTILGAIHLYYTFFTNKFDSRDEDLNSAMKEHSPALTKETTMWKAWIGFNASHSSGAMFIGIMNIFLVEYYFDSLQNSIFFFAFNTITVIFYLWLAKNYWFKIPFLGISIALICFVTSAIIALFS
jgi:hypothetical protein